MPKPKPSAKRAKINAVCNSLIELESEIEELQRKREKLKDQLIKLGVRKHETTKGVVMLSTYDRPYVNYANVVAHLKPSAKLLQRHTTLTTIRQLRVKKK